LIASRGFEYDQRRTEPTQLGNERRDGRLIVGDMARDARGSGDVEGILGDSLT
jgi:hypothetical protein